MSYAMVFSYVQWVEVRVRLYVLMILVKLLSNTVYVCVWNILFIINVCNGKKVRYIFINIFHGWKFSVFWLISVFLAKVQTVLEICVNLIVVKKQLYIAGVIILKIRFKFTNMKVIGSICVTLGSRVCSWEIFS
jgi:hypothetical protein